MLCYVGRPVRDDYHVMGTDRKGKYVFVCSAVSAYMPRQMPKAMRQVEIPSFDGLDRGIRSLRPRLRPSLFSFG